MKLIKMELHRLLAVNKVIFILVGCLLLKAVVLYLVPEMKDSRIQLSHKQYDYYLEILYGEDTEEKQQFITTEYDTFLALFESYGQMYEAHTVGELTDEAWSDYVEQYEVARIRLAALGIFKEKMEEFQQVYPYDAIDPPQYFYDYGWKTYFTYLAFPDVLAILSMLLLAVQIFGGDISTGAVNLLRSTRHGKQRLFLSRTALCVVSSVVLSAVHMAVEYLSFSLKMPLNDAGAPLYSLPNFAGVPFPTSIIKGLLLVYLFRTLGLCLVGLFVLYLSILLKNMVGTLCCTVAAVTLPLLLNSLPGGFIAYTYTGFLTGGDVIKNYVNMANPLFCLLPLLLLLLITVLLFFGAKRVYQNGHFQDA